MPFMAVLIDLELKKFFVAQPWWATFKMGLWVIFVGKTHKSFLKT